MNKKIISCAISLIIIIISMFFFKRGSKKSDYYIENLGPSVVTLNPLNCCDFSSIRVIYDIYEGLVDYDNNGEIINTGCTSYEKSDDGLTYIFHLRKNAKWCNGDDVTAEDYVYSLRRCLDPKTLCQSFIEQLFDIKNAKSIYKGELNVEKLGVFADDKYTLRIELENSNSEFIYYVTLPVYYPVYRKSIEKYGLSAFFKVDNIVSNGAYIIKSWIPNGYIILEKNDKYWDKNNVKIKKVKFLMISDGSVDLNTFRSGNEDMTAYALPRKKIEDYKKEFGDQCQVYDVLAQNRIVFNLKKEKYQDIKVRKAFSIALDREKIVKTLITCSPSYTIIPENTSNGIYKDDIKDFEEFDWIDKSIRERNKLAQDLLKEAGYSKENPLKIDIYLFSNDDMKKVGTTLQDIFTRAFEGLVICTLSFDDWSTYLDNLIKGNFDIVWSCWIADYNTPSSLSMLYYGGNDNNYGFYKDEDFDYNYKKSLTSNKEDYIKYQKKCNKIATQSFCAIPFSIDKRIRLVKSNIKGFKGNVLDRIKTKLLEK